MPVIFLPDRVLLDRQVRKFGHYISGAVLDVGAGAFDRYSNAFAHGTYIRLDTNRSAGIQVVGSADALPFKSEAFDGVVCTQVLQYMKDPQGTINEMHRVLKRPAHLIITVPQTNEIDAAPYEYYRYTRFGISEILRTAGFEVITVDQRGGFFATIAQQSARYLIDHLRLYQRRRLARLAKPFASLFGRAMIKLDQIDGSDANRRHAIGWCIVARKATRAAGLRRPPATAPQ